MRTKEKRQRNINGNEYDFIKDIRDDQQIRKSFNLLI